MSISCHFLESRAILRAVYQLNNSLQQLDRYKYSGWGKYVRELEAVKIQGMGDGG